MADDGVYKDGIFRTVLETLRESGNGPATMQRLQSCIIDEVFSSIRATPGRYKGQVFKDRDDKSYEECSKEEHFVAKLFHLCHSEKQGILTIGDDPFWLLGFEWPNQGGNREKKRRADLVGIDSGGCLVVFECKLGSNQDAPGIAFAEGLDYSANLLRRENFKMIQDGFLKWSKKRDIPDAFIHIKSLSDASMPASVILLAPPEYYEKHEVTRADQSLLPSGRLVRLRMAVNDFNSASAKWK